MVLRDLPTFSEMRPVTTLNPTGQWQANDSFGDFRMGVIELSGVKYYLIIWHWFGGVAARKAYDGDPYAGWPANVVANPVQSIPRVDSTPSALNMDTWDWVQNPGSELVTATCAVNPGALPGGGATGHVFAIQRATSADPTADPADWSRDPAEIILEPDPSAPWEGPNVFGMAYSHGILEQSIVHLPGSSEFAIFYTGEVIEEGSPDFTGATLKRRIGRAVAPAAGFDTLPVFTRTPAAGASSWVWDPIEDGAKPGQSYGTFENAVWGTAYVPIQPHVSRNPDDGLLHMVLLEARPNTLIGQQNLSWAIGHWWSDDDGLTWTGDVNNPLVTSDHVSAAFGSPIISADFLNSPHLFWDAGKVYLAFAANPDGGGEPAQGVYGPGTQLMLMEATVSAEARFGRSLPDVLRLWDVDSPGGDRRLVVPATPTPYLGLP